MTTGPGPQQRGRIRGIDHWGIVAGDLERTLRFYEKLGINDAQKINVHDPDGNLVEFTVYDGAPRR